MVTIGSLWLAILLSAALVWIMSALVWMVLPHHRSDWARVASEDAARDALRGLAPGQYNLPHLESPKELEQPEARAKFTDGPVGFVTIVPNGVPSMGKHLAATFLFYVVVGVVTAYLASRTLPPGTEYLTVFRVTGTVAWLAYGMAVVPDAIWFGRPWSAVLKWQFDALLYGLLTAGTFAWQWPS